MAESIIKAPYTFQNVSDVIYQEVIGETYFSIPGTSDRNVITEGWVSHPTVPAGYTEIMWGVKSWGDAAVLPTGINSGWVRNTRSAATNQIRAAAWNLCAKIESDTVLQSGGNNALTKKKKYLFIGDSYAEGYSHDGNNPGWVYYVAQYLGLNANDYISKYHGGWGFGNTGFLSLLNEVVDTDVTDVVVCGGFNERNYTAEQIMTGITNFKTAAAQKWQGVNVHVGFIAYIKQGTSTGALDDWETIRATLMSTVLPTYQKAITVGCHYLSNAEYWLNEAGLTNSDGYHPSAVGNSNIGMAVTNALISGSAPLPYNGDLRL